MGPRDIDTMKFKEEDGERPKKRAFLRADHERAKKKDDFFLFVRAKGFSFKSRKREIELRLTIRGESS